MFEDFDVRPGTGPRPPWRSRTGSAIPKGIAYAQLNIGWCHSYLGGNEEAQAAFERALELYRDLDDPVGPLEGPERPGRAVPQHVPVRARPGLLHPEPGRGPSARVPRTARPRP
ncbi:MAG: tetratricopeptide repeat protein [Desulfobacterales bacterium]|nr:tetratricopeptide repeat protein [Desulfobacterales bacterium]